MRQLVPITEATQAPGFTSPDVDGGFLKSPSHRTRWECFQAEASWRDSGACIFGKCSQTTLLIKELNLCQVLSTFR